MTVRPILRKAERLCLQQQQDALFSGGGKSFALFPLRVVCTWVDDAPMPPVSVLFSVSKRRFKRAVKRNRVKRQLREAYRLNKGILWEAVKPQAEAHHRRLAVAFLWLSDELLPTRDIEARMQLALHRLAESLPPLTEEKSNE